MKTRTISAIVVLAIAIPIFLMGGYVYTAAIYVLSLLALREFIKIKETKKDLPEFMEFISYIILTLVVLSNVDNKDLVFSIDFRVISALFISYLLPTIVYHDSKVYSVNDAFYLISGIFFLGISFNLLILLRNVRLALIAYLFLISVITDTYAYLVGMLVGRHKLIESISPKKTWEGSVGGTLMSIIIAGTFYHVVVNPNLNIAIVMLMTTFLSIIGQFGDLVFSAIKRYFGKKDFSNIMPGHGGVLDRLDSIIFIMLAFMFFISII